MLDDVRGWIFDMDGTLADSMEHYYRMATGITELAGVPAPSREHVLSLMGAGDPDLLRKLLPAGARLTDARLGEIVSELRPAWRSSLESIEPIAGTLDLLAALDERGFSLGIATSSGRNLPYLDRWGVRHVFRAIVGREDVTHRKPHPESILLCLERLGLEPDQAAYVGDSPIDVEAGRAAGVRTVAVLTGTSSRDTLQAARPDHIVVSAADLLELLAPAGA